MLDCKVIDFDFLVKTDFSVFSIQELVLQSDVIVITHNDKRFRDTLIEVLPMVSTKKIIIDCWRIFNVKDFERNRNVKYIPMGIYSE